MENSAACEAWFKPTREARAKRQNTVQRCEQRMPQATAPPCPQARPREPQWRTTPSISRVWDTSSLPRARGNDAAQGRSILAKLSAKSQGHKLHQLLCPLAFFTQLHHPHNAQAVSSPLNQSLLSLKEGTARFFSFLKHSYFLCNCDLFFVQSERQYAGESCPRTGNAIPVPLIGTVLSAMVHGLLQKQRLEEDKLTGNGHKLWI